MTAAQTALQSMLSGTAESPEGEAIYLVTCSLNGTNWRADAPSTTNCVFFDADDITWLEEPNWDERQIPGRDILAQTFLGNSGEQLSFTSSMNDQHAALQPLATVNNQIDLLKKWNREGQVLQFISTYHNMQMMCVIRSFQRVSPIAFSTDNYYDYTIKLREWSPVIIETNIMAAIIGEIESLAGAMLGDIMGMMGGGGGLSSMMGGLGGSSGLGSLSGMMGGLMSKHSDTSKWSLHDILSDRDLTHIAHTVIKHRGHNWTQTADRNHVAYAKKPPRGGVL